MVSNWSKLFMLKIYGWELQLQSWDLETSRLQLLKILKPVKLSSFAQEVLSFLLQLRG